MPESHLIVRDPLLDANQQLLGYQFFWQRRVAGEQYDVDQEARALLACVETLFAATDDNDDDDAEDGNAAFPYRCYLPVSLELLLEGAFVALPARALGLIVTPEVLADPQAHEVLKAMHHEAYEIVLRGADLSSIQPEMLALCDFTEVRFEPGNFTAQARIYSLLKNSSLKMAASRVANWSEYAICNRLGLSSFVGRFFFEASPTDASAGAHRSKTLNPSQATLLRMMEGVQANIDIDKLEGLLKHDAGISYKLLFYINSAAFGLGFEIKSLRHAIQMLGYKPLYRWLCVLLATSDTGHASPVLLQAALVRGRLMELLGEKLLAAADAENLFLTGMFSLLDRLLDVDMAQALEQINLPESVADALIDGVGICQPFLNLAKSCESELGDANSSADELGISVDEINEAHFKALRWAQTLIG